MRNRVVIPFQWMKQRQKDFRRVVFVIPTHIRLVLIQTRDHLYNNRQVQVIQKLKCISQRAEQSTIVQHAAMLKLAGKFQFQKRRQKDWVHVVFVNLTINLNSFFFHVIISYAPCFIKT